MGIEFSRLKIAAQVAGDDVGSGARGAPPVKAGDALTAQPSGGRGPGDRTTGQPRRRRRAQSPEARRQVERAQSGDSSSFERVYLRLEPRVRRAVFLLLRDQHEVEDIVQDTFFAVYRRLPGLNDIGAFDSWVLRIARNLALDHARRLKRCRPSLRAYEDGADSAPDLPRVVHRSGTYEVSPESRALVLEAFERLPTNVQRTLRLRYALGLSCGEIAEREGLGPSCVKTRLHRGRRELRTALLS